MRRLFLWTAAALIALSLSGCHTMVPEENDAPQTLYASFPPIYALAAPIVEGVPGITLKCLVQPQDGCLRNYELSDWDEAVLSGADAVILAGRGLESFETQLLSGSIAVIGAMDGLTLINNGATAAEGDEADHFQDENPWAFLSVEDAREMCSVITAGMIELDPGYESLYTENYSNFDAKLEALEGRISEMMVNAPEVSVAIMHEGLFYVADELGLDTAAVIEREPGTSLSETEFSEALETLKASEAKVVLLESQAPDSLKTALSDAGYSIALIDTFSTHMSDNPDDYVSTAEKNAQAVIAALENAAQ